MHDLVARHFKEGTPPATPTAPSDWNASTTRHQSAAPTEDDQDDWYVPASKTPTTRSPSGGLGTRHQPPSVFALGAILLRDQLVTGVRPPGPPSGPGPTRPTQSNVPMAPPPSKSTAQPAARTPAAGRYSCWNAHASYTAQEGGPSAHSLQVQAPPHRHVCCRGAERSSERAYAHCDSLDSACCAGVVSSPWTSCLPALHNSRP